MTVTAEDRYQRIRHNYRAGLHGCFFCGWAPSNWRHRTGSRCSVCLKYYPHYELDGSRRCDSCRP